MHYQIEYYNKLWKDWLAFDQLFYKTEEQAQKRIDEYKESVPSIQIRIVQITILNKKQKRTSKKNSKITVKKI
jgi:hypothetical protein